MRQGRVRLFPVIAAVFLIVPIIEIYLLIQVGGIIGALPTIGLVVLTAVLGVMLLRMQGIQTFLRFQQSLVQGRNPAGELLEGVALLIGGALLLTPGFFTDAIGFACLVPVTRRTLVTWLIARFGSGLQGSLHTPRAYRTRGNVYEGESTRHDDGSTG